MSIHIVSLGRGTSRFPSRDQESIGLLGTWFLLTREAFKSPDFPDFDALCGIIMHRPLSLFVRFWIYVLCIFRNTGN